MGESDNLLDVLIIGAGISGLAVGHNLNRKAPWARYAILEARADLGGTWDLFKFPGVRSDSEMHTLGFSFAPWRGARSIADGADIQQYLVDVADREGISPHISFNHRATHSEWRTDEGRWQVSVETPTGTKCYKARFLVMASGYYRYDKGYTPSFPGMDDFRGDILHPQLWPEGEACKDKNVVVIGSGATAVSLAPALAQTARRVTILQRTPSYVYAIENGYVEAGDFKGLHLLRRRALRWWRIFNQWASFKTIRALPGMGRKFLINRAAKELPDDFDVATHLTPPYDPWTQRVCAVPDGDLFKAVRSGKLEFVTDEIDRLTPDGIQLKSSTELKADTIVTATGLVLQFGGNCSFSVDGNAVDFTKRLAYRSAMIDGVPNMVTSIGYLNASWTLRAELVAGFVCRLITALKDRPADWVVPKAPLDVFSDKPLMDWSSGYIQRAADILPRQGKTSPWRYSTSYYSDVFNLKLRSLDSDGLLNFGRGDTLTL